MPHSNDYDDVNIDRSRLRPGMKIDPMESPGIDMSDAEIDDLIADTLAVNRRMSSEPQAEPTPQAEDAAMTVPGPEPRTKRPPARDKRRAQADDRACYDGVEELASAASKPRRIRPLKPKLRAIAIAAVIASAFVWPWAIPVALLVLFWTVLVFFIFVGFERMVGALIGIYRWMHPKWPDRAESYRARLDRMALACDAVLDRLPGAWTEDVYLPDFSRENLIPGLSDPWPEPFDRIGAEVRQS